MAQRQHQLAVAAGQQQPIGDTAGCTADSSTAQQQQQQQQDEISKSLQMFAMLTAYSNGNGKFY